MIVEGRGLVLRRVATGEADLVVSLLTNTGERLALFARNSRKSRRRLAAHLFELGNYISVSFEDRRARLGGDSQLFSVREADVLEDFRGLRTDYDRLSVGLRLIQIIEKLTREHAHGVEDLFRLLAHALSVLQSVRVPKHLEIHFTIRLLASQGIYDPHGDERDLLQTTLAAHEQLRMTDENWSRIGPRAAKELTHFLGQAVALEKQPSLLSPN